MFQFSVLKKKWIDSFDIEHWLINTNKTSIPFGVKVFYLLKNGEIRIAQKWTLPNEVALFMMNLWEARSRSEYRVHIFFLFWLHVFNFCSFAHIRLWISSMQYWEINFDISGKLIISSRAGNFIFRRRARRPTFLVRCSNPCIILECVIKVYKYCQKWQIVFQYAIIYNQIHGYVLLCVRHCTHARPYSVKITSLINKENFIKTRI